MDILTLYSKTAKLLVRFLLQYRRELEYLNQLTKPI